MYQKKLIIFMVLLMGFILNMISVQIVGSSFKYIQAELNASVDQISYIMSASLIAEVIIIPFSGWLARLLSTRYLFLISLGGFLIASFGCTISNSFLSMVIFRGLQGFFGGAMLPLMVTSIYSLFRPKDIPFILSIAATLGVSSIALGPILGGFLTEFINWRWMFIYNIPVGLIIFILGFFYIDLSKREKDLLKKIDYQGIIYLAISLVSFLFFIEEGERRDWFESNLIMYSFFIFLLFIIAFINRELTSENPIIDLKVFYNRNFTIGCLGVVVFAITLYIPIFLIPVFLGAMRLIDPLDIGLTVSSMGIAMMLSGPIAGRILKQYGVKIVVIIGCLITGIGTYLQSNLTSEYIFNNLLFSQILKGVGTQFLWMGSQYISLANIKSSSINNASAMFNLILRLFAAVSIALSSNYLSKWQREFFSHISENYNVKNSTIFELKFNNLVTEDELSRKYQEYFFLLSEREGIVMAFNKIAFLSSWTIFIPLLLISFIKKEKSSYLY